MATAIEVAPHSDAELTLGRVLVATPQNLFRCWTEPSLITRWFTPPPWRTVAAEIDARPGGRMQTTMHGPNGEVVVNHGVVLDAAAPERLIFTDAFSRAWEPSGKAFMVVHLSFLPHGAGTRYIVRIKHWSAQDRKTHEEMGFAIGWGIATDQLEALAATL
jgi:uncharacterized protein YndB with AHSA1/START domain